MHTQVDRLEVKEYTTKSWAHILNVGVALLIPLKLTFPEVQNPSSSSAVDQHAQHFWGWWIPGSDSTLLLLYVSFPLLFAPIATPIPRWRVDNAAKKLTTVVGFM